MWLNLSLFLYRYWDRDGSAICKGDGFNELETLILWTQPFPVLLVITAGVSKVQ